MNDLDRRQKISLIIVTYNRKDMLEEVLSAIVTQTRLPDEVIVVDNNSSDATKEVVLSFKDKLNMHYVFEGVQGTSTARNTGIKNASNDIIVFTDDDCVPEKEWLYHLEQPFLRDPSIGVVGGEILGCRVKGTMVEDFCIADAILRVGDPNAKEEA